jgi:hypothetical protein
MPVKYQTTYSGLIIPWTRSIAQKTVLYQIILAPASFSRAIRSVEQNRAIHPKYSFPFSTTMPLHLSEYRPAPTA